MSRPFRPSGSTARAVLMKIARPAFSPLRAMRIFSLAGMFLLSFVLDLSVWFPLFSKGFALLLQGLISLKLCFEERYLFIRLRHLSWKKRLLPIVLFGIGLLFYIEKLFLFIEIWKNPAGDLTAPYRLYSIIFFVSAFSIYTLRFSAIAQFLGRLRLKPAQTLAMSFVLMILLGTLLLSVPQMVVDPSKISFIDALFTATSAATVTGLSLFPISEFYRAGGQWVILLLIQLGGLGIMTFGALLSLITHRHIRLHDAVLLHGALETESVGTVKKEIQLIFLITLTIEAMGALLLWLSFPSETPFPLFQAIFHSVSAFCNAGFSLFPNNLEGYVSEFSVNGVIAALIILGGLGFPVLNNLSQYPLFNQGKSTWRLTFHSKLVLSTSALLLVAGTVGLLIFEYQGELKALAWHEKFVAAAFQSVTARTAGFNTLNLSLFSDGGLFLLMVLMWIGGSPASTAGGIKTTTFGVMIATLRAVLRGREEVELFNRRLSPAAIQKSLSLAFISSALLVIFLMLMFLIEDGSFKSILFETVSAFNTVGLSTGITPRFSPLGKVILVAAMFVGRIGPLTLAFSLAERTSKGKYSYPQEKVIVG